MKIEQWPVDRPKPYPKNPRKIPAAAVKKVAASIREFGFQQPIVVDRKGVVIVGHGRLLAAQELKLEKVPVLVARDLSPARVRAYRIADNRLNQDSAWDEELLSLEIADLMGQEFDLELTGFEPSELTALVPPAGGHTDEDDAPAAPDRPISRLGDVWRCGPHRLLCGDATKAEDVARLLAGAKPNLMVTDPPYGIGFRYRDHDDRDNAQNRQLVERTFALAPTAKVWTPGLNNLARDIGLFQKIKILCWWKKFSQAGNGLGGANTWEPVFVVGVKNGRLPNDHLEFPTDRVHDLLSGHPCPKPVALFRHLIEKLAGDGASVYDPFIGSGTTMIAAETIGRVCYGIDIDPVYVDVAVKRWQDFTGGKARLEGGGLFASVSRSRARHGKEAKAA
jgi:hypothetical protein